MHVIASGAFNPIVDVPIGIVLVVGALLTWGQHDKEKARQKEETRAVLRLEAERAATEKRGERGEPGSPWHNAYLVELESLFREHGVEYKH